MKKEIHIYTLFIGLILVLAAFFNFIEFHNIQSPLVPLNLEKKQIIAEQERQVEENQELGILDSKNSEYSQNLPQLGELRRIWYKGQSYDAFILNKNLESLSFYTQKSNGQAFSNIGDLKKELSAKGKVLRFATNGGIFKPNFKPCGLYVENGQELSPLNLKKGQGNFYLPPNGVFFVTHYGTANIIPSARYPDVQSVVKFATQSGPILISRNQINPLFQANSQSKHIRNGVGCLDAQHIVFVISNQRVNFYQFAEVFKEYFECEKALYLDGNISKMYVPPLRKKDLGGRFSVLIGISQ